MSSIDEQYRLRHFWHGEIPSGLYSTLTFVCERSSECVERILCVMEVIARHRRDDWPDDTYWSEQLPEWLLKTFSSYTPQQLSEILSDKSRWIDLAWTFGSWLDRMRDRDWQWWSLLDSGEGTATIYLAIYGHPCSTKALEHLVVAAGGKILQKQP